MKTFNESLHSQQTEAEILSTVSKAEEFEQLKVAPRPPQQLWVWAETAVCVCVCVRAGPR